MNNKYPLTSEEVTYFENNEIVCMKAIKEEKIFQEDESWFKTINEDLIPEHMKHSNSDNDPIKNFNVDEFITEYNDVIAQDDLVELLGCKLLDDNDTYYMTLKKKAYERAMAIKQRTRS